MRARPSSVFTLFSSYKRKPTSCLYSTATTTTSASPSTLPRFKQLVSSPHPISQIRLIRYTHFADSLVDPQEKAWRAREEQLQLKHHYFWADNNTRFHSEKTDFEEKFLLEQGREPTSEDLSVFYKDFLDKAYPRHMAYSKAWWRENFEMVFQGGIRADLNDLRHWLVMKAASSKQQSTTTPMLHISSSSLISKLSNSYFLLALSRKLKRFVKIWVVGSKFTVR